MSAFYEHMLNQSVDLEPFDSLDDDGSPTFGALVTGLDARVEREIEMTGDDTGVTSDTVTTVWVGREVGEGDRIHLPSGDVMEVQAVESDPSVDGQTTLYKAQG